MSAVAWLSKKLDDGRILCEACSQRCKLKEGEYGICGVRKVENSKLRLLTYSLAAAFNIDPIEKKPLFHFLPSSKVLSVGTVGCNFSCKFCQNADISQYPKEHNFRVAGTNLPPQKIVETAKEYDSPSIAYTYNEPAVFFEYAYDTAKLAHQKGLKNIFVTSGYETHKAIDTIAPYLDAMNIDLKSFNDKFYQDICGARLKPVLECIKYAHSKGIWIEITTLLIPSHNDSDEEIKKMAQFIADIDKSIPWHVSAFYPQYKMKNTPPTPPSTLTRAYETGKEAGLYYVYVGNINDKIHESTYCPKCNEIVIDRRGHLGQFVINKLDIGGICPYCGYKIQGVWQ